MFNPWIILAVIIALAAAGYEGFSLGADHEVARQAKTVALIAAVKEQAQQGAADAIAKIDITQTTINRKVETITREVPVYRECLNTPDVERLLNDARAGLDRPNSAGGGVMPGPRSSPAP